MHWLFFLLLAATRSSHPGPAHTKATGPQPASEGPAVAPGPPPAPPLAAPPAPAPKPAEKVEAAEPVTAQEDSQTDWFSEAYPFTDRVFDAYAARTVRKGTLNAYINHRNREGILVNPLRELLGFDGGGLKIALGVRYGIVDWLDIGIFRQNGTVEVFDTYELDARAQFLKTTVASYPLELAARAGLSWFNMPSSNALAGFGEVLATTMLFDRALVSLGLLFSSNSSGPTKKQTDTQFTGAFQLSGDMRLLDYLAVGAELTWGVVGYHDTFPVLTFGPKFLTNRHTFAIVITNSQSMTVDSIVANTYRITPKSWLLGFNITREF